jgi:hypothetical protein
MTAFVLALLSALSFAASTVVQHRAASAVEVAPGRAAPARLLVRLLRTPAWLAGQGAAVAGFVLHGLALRAGAVTLVQPLLASGLVLALALGALVDRRHPGRRLPTRLQWAAAGAAALGVAVFLVGAAPAPGTPTGRPGSLLIACGGALAVQVAAWIWTSRATARHRALALGSAAGVGFGMTGVLLKQVVSHAPTSWSEGWPLVALLLVGGGAVVAAQAAYRAGSLIETLPALTVLEPVVAVAVAAWAFGEHLAPGLLARSGQLAGLVLLAGGVITLARRPTADLVAELVPACAADRELAAA